MVTIRKAVHSDAEILWKIRTEAIRRICARIYSEEVIEKWSATLMPHDWESYLEEKQAIVAVRNEKAVGFGLVDLDTQSLEALFVWPDMAGKGVGRALVAELEDFALSNGVKVLRLSSTLNAVEFYKMAGYRVDRKGVFEHPNGFNFDCYEMSKQL